MGFQPGFLISIAAAASNGPIAVGAQEFEAIFVSSPYPTNLLSDTFMCIIANDHGVAPRAESSRLPLGA